MIVAADICKVEPIAKRPPGGHSAMPGTLRLHVGPLPLPGSAGFARHEPEAVSNTCDNRAVRMRPPLH